LCEWHVFHLPPMLHPESPAPNRFTDMTGEKQTMRGSYLIPVSYSNHPTPPMVIN